MLSSRLVTCIAGRSRFASAVVPPPWLSTSFGYIVRDGVGIQTEIAIDMTPPAINIETAPAASSV
jgi:hypothetical protein